MANAELINETDGAACYLAGEIVQPGAYQDIDSGRVVYVTEGGEVLPASCSGHVAAYIALPLTWGDLHWGIGQNGDIRNGGK